MNVFFALNLSYEILLACFDYDKYRHVESDIGTTLFSRIRDYGEFHHLSNIHDIVRKQIPDPIKTMLSL